MIHAIFVFSGRSSNAHLTSTQTQKTVLPRTSRKIAKASGKRLHCKFNPPLLESTPCALGGEGRGRVERNHSPACPSPHY